MCANGFLRSSLSLLLMGGALSLVACGGGDEFFGFSSGGSGTLNVSMTDAPSCGFDHVFVTVSGVRVHTDPNADVNGSGWVDVTVSPPLRIDLLSLTNGALATLGQTSLAAGTYQQIRLVLALNGAGALANSVVPTGGTEQALDTPSAAQAGIKIIRSFTVARGTLTGLVLDFDACRSIVALGNGSFSLNPVVSALPTAVSGAVTGALANAPGARVYAQRNGVVVKTTVADANGNFTLSPVEQSSAAGNVDVVIVPTSAAGRGSGIVRGVPVVAGGSTAIATAFAAITLPASAFRTVSGTVTPASAQAIVRALQLTGGGSFEIAATAAASDSGAYRLFRTQPALPAAAPVVGTYQTVLPIPLMADTGAAGAYSIQASSAAGAVITQQVNVAGADATQNFAF
ncbi:DUF4382 domain-containing protein [Cupriavidus basilensis]